MKFFNSKFQLTEQQVQQVYDNATACGTCNEEFSEDNRIVRHHCHATGEFFGATWNNCNLQLKQKEKKSKKRRNHDNDDEKPKQFATFLQQASLKQTQGK